MTMHGGKGTAAVNECYVRAVNDGYVGDTFIP